MGEIPQNFESRESNVGIKQNIIAAVEARDKEALFKALAAASKFLTDNWFGGDEDALRQQDQELSKFFSELEQKGEAHVKIYIGDGGISRLIIWVEDNQITIEPSPVSSDKVKKRWEEL